MSARRPFEPLPVRRAGALLPTLAVLFSLVACGGTAEPEAEPAPEPVTSSALGITFSVVRPDRPLSGPLRPAGSLPQTWLIDRAGRVRATRVGLVAERALRRACTTLLQEGGG